MLILPAEVLGSTVRARNLSSVNRSTLSLQLTPQVSWLSHKIQWKIRAWQMQIHFQTVSILTFIWDFYGQIIHWVINSIKRIEGIFTANILLPSLIIFSVDFSGLILFSRQVFNVKILFHHSEQPHNSTTIPVWTWRQHSFSVLQCNQVWKADISICSFWSSLSVWFGIRV